MLVERNQPLRTSFTTRSPAPEYLAHEDATSPGHRSRAFRNVPSGESDESSVEVIEVLDPCHPLYGRTFRVIRRVGRGSGNFSPSYEVEYLQNHSLLVPISVTEAYNGKANQTKLSIEALRDLVLTVECLESHEHGSEGSVGSAAASSAASDCRGCRRGSGGGLS